MGRRQVEQGLSRQQAGREGERERERRRRGLASVGENSLIGAIVLEDIMSYWSRAKNV